MKQILRFFLGGILIANIIFANDVVVNVDPNPVTLGQPFRVSLVSSIPIQTAELSIGNQLYSLVFVTDELFRISLLSSESMMSQQDNVFINVVTKEGASFTLPVKLSINDEVSDSSESFLKSFDTRKKSVQLMSDSSKDIERLQDQLDLMGQKERDLNKKINDLQQQLAKNEYKGLKKLELHKQEKQLKQLQKNLLLQDQKKADMIESLKQQMSAYNQKQSELLVKEATLKQLQEDLLVHSDTLSLKEKDLQSIEQSLNHRESDLDQKGELVNQKEFALQLLQDDIDQQVKTLSVYQENLNEKESKLLGQKQLLTLQKKQLDDQESELTELSDAISEERHILIKKNRDFQKEKDQFETDKNRVYSSLEERNKVLQRKSKKINALESDLISGLDHLSTMEATYSERMSDLELAQTQLGHEVDAFKQDRHVFEQEKQSVKDVEMELAVKYELMQNMGVYLEHQLSKMRDNYHQSKRDQVSYIETMDQRMQKLDGLTRLVEKRANRIDRLNSKLLNKNRKLDRQLKYLLRPNYRYGFSPYMGVRLFDSSSGVNDAKEYGVHFSTYFGSNYSLTGGFGYLNYLNGSQDAYAEVVQTTMYSLDFGYTINPLEKARLFLNAGVEGDVSADYFPLHLTSGISFKYFYKPNMVTKVDFRYSSEPVIMFGIEKHITPTKALPPIADILLTPLEEQKKVDQSENVVDVSLNVPERRFQFFPKQYEFDDLKKHWAKKPAQRVTNLGLMQPKIKKQDILFNPKDRMTYQEASSALVWMYYLDQLIAPKSTPIHVTISGEPDQTVTMTVSLYDDQGKKVDTLVDEQTFYPGQHHLEWDGRTGSELAEPGAYIVKCELKMMQLGVNMMGKYDAKEAIVAVVEDTIYVEPVYTLFDHPDYVDLVVSDSSDSSYLPEAMRLMLLPKNISSVPSSSTIAMTRIEFITSVSKLLLQLGAEPRAISVDFSPYKDWDRVPYHLKRYLTTYVVELGYGGDSTARLNPNDIITRAEVAVIMDRVIHWRQEELAKQQINVNFDRYVSL